MNIILYLINYFINGWIQKKYNKKPILYHKSEYIYNNPPNVVILDKNGISLSVGGWYKNVTTIKNNKNNIAI